MLWQILISKPSLSWVKNSKDSEGENPKGTCPVPRTSLRVNSSCKFCITKIMN